jgi:polar amino acid transport system substrate-binding protein
MKILSKFIAGTVAMVAFTTYGQAGEVLDKVMEEKSMIFATNSEYPPASYLNSKGKFEGFDVDVSKELAKRMGVEAKFINPAWEAITSGKWGDRWQVAIGSMTPTPARAEVLDFPVVYYFTPAALYVHESAPYKTLKDLKGKKIGASAGSTYEAYLNKELKLDSIYSPKFDYLVEAGEIRTYETDTNVIDDLRLGDGVRLDAGISSVPNIHEATKNGYPLRIIGEPLFFEPLAVVVAKGDSEFSNKVRNIVEEMRSDGTLKTLSVKWFGVDLVTTRSD